MSEQSRKSQLGQFFTVNTSVQDAMRALLRHSSIPSGPITTVLEPSAGAGHLSKVAMDDFPDAQVESWELDDSVVALDGIKVIYGDFFDLSRNRDGDFDAIISNPPYVAWKNVDEETKRSATGVKTGYSDKTNLYHLFLDRCIDLLAPSGHMVVICPKEWVYSTSAKTLRQKMWAQGVITDFIDCGEEKLFPDADVPALLIFRFEKKSEGSSSSKMSSSLFNNQVEGQMTLFDLPSASPRGTKETAAFHDDTQEDSSRPLRYRKGLTGEDEQRYLSQQKGYWNISSQPSSHENMVELGDLFSVSVGLVSGADKIFNVTHHPHLDSYREEGTVINMLTTKGMESYIFVDDYSSFDSIPEATREYLSSHKEALISRRIRAFDENNWWKYGAMRNRKVMENGKEKIYVLGRTRRKDPFFLSPETRYFGGGILCLSPKVSMSNIDIKGYCDYFNSDDFRERCESFGLTTANKVSFQPATLMSMMIPQR